MGGDGTDNNNWAAVAQVERGFHWEISHSINYMQLENRFRNQQSH